jgi:excinuclease ABC subunit A
MDYEDGFKSYSVTNPFDGVIPNLEKRLRKGDTWLKEELSRFMNDYPCQSCSGKRLKPEALAVKIEGLDITEVTHMSISEALAWFSGLGAKLTSKRREIARRILREINERLGFLNNVGLEYLTLSRASRTLSGGESQRIRLASQIGSGLTGVLYVLDEPSIGLHQRDNRRLLDTLIRLRDLGNSVLVVEHDEEAILSADTLIDMGLGAGIHGGEVVATGTPREVMACKESLTAQYLTGERFIPVPGHGALESWGRPSKSTGRGLTTSRTST